MTAKRTRRLRLTLTALLPSLPLTSAWTGNSSPKVRIQVCQNKDCCSRWSGSGSLVDALQDLIPPESVTAGVTVEATGCLSRCGTGPNVCLKLAGSPDTQLHEVENAVAASVKLQTATAGSIQLPPKLLAAVSVMEKAQKASSLDEKERLLSSVIQALRTDTALMGSMAVGHAFALRASARYKAANYHGALEDAQQSLQSLHQPSTTLSATVTWQAQAWRVLADSHEAVGNLGAAIDALQQWAIHVPSFRTKATKEIQRLQVLQVGKE